MKIFLLYNQFFSNDGNQRKIGGIETYMENLARLFTHENYDVFICQLSSQCFIKDETFGKVYGFPVKNIHKLYSSIQHLVDKKNDIIIFMSDIHSIKLNDVRTISIQHGIYWDMPIYTGRFFSNKIKRLRIAINGFRNFNKCKNSVCVDYNFYNWYKTFNVKEKLNKNIWIIPNFSSKNLTSIRNDFSSNQIKIIFARRFEQYRGSILFASVMKEILEKYENVLLTIAGEGPCENQMKNILYGFQDRVNFIKYMPDESFKIHSSHDIAVVPTIGSEGTSLSLLEAMGAGCLVVATPVGGMSNILIDEFNGFVAMPNKESLFDTLEKAITINADEKRFVLTNSLNTVKKGFSLEKWQKSWLGVIQNLEK